MTTRILFVAPRVPFPPNIGWNQRMFHSLRALSAVGDVDLVCGREEPFVDVDLEPLECLCRSVRLVDLASVPDPPGPGSRAAAVQRYVLARHPTHIAQLAALIGGIALPLALDQVIGPGRALFGIVLGAVALGGFVLARLHGRAEGWKIAVVLLVLFVLYSVFR